MTKQEILDFIKQHNEGEDLGVSWMDEDNPICIIVKYPQKLETWQEYEKTSQRIHQLIIETKESGKLANNTEVFVFHVPLETKMPLGNPTTKLLQSAKELENSNVSTVYAVIFDQFARLATRTVSLAMVSQGVNVKLKILGTLEEAVDKIFDLQNQKIR